MFHSTGIAWGYQRIRRCMSPNSSLIAQNFRGTFAVVVIQKLFGQRRQGEAWKCIQECDREKNGWVVLFVAISGRRYDDRVEETRSHKIETTDSIYSKVWINYWNNQILIFVQYENEACIDLQFGHSIGTNVRKTWHSRSTGSQSR